MAEKLGNRMRQIPVFCAIAAGIVLFGSCGRSAVEPGPGEVNASFDFDETNPLGPNAACYVCHIPFVKEQLSKTHLYAKVGCIDCHGISAGHANDEDIGATKPDITFKGEQVNEMCLKCHKTHDVPAEEVIACYQKLLERHPDKRRPNCADCHGTHRINKPIESREKSRRKRNMRDFGRLFEIKTMAL